MSLTINTFNNVKSSGDKSPGFWSYDTSSDNFAAVSGSGYFNELFMRFHKGDIIYVNSSDNSNFLLITSDDAATVVTTTASIIAPITVADGSITTAKLANDAVTNAKLADGAVSLENLDSGIAPGGIQVFSGTLPTVGGSVNESFTVAGLTIDAIVMAVIKTQGPAGLTILTVTVDVGFFALKFDQDPLNTSEIMFTASIAAT